MMSIANTIQIQNWQGFFKKLNEGAELRARASLRRLSKRIDAYDKKLLTKKLLYPATEPEVRALQRNRCSLSSRKVREALERDFYTCTCCGSMQVWILDVKKEKPNRLYREYGLSYYSRASVVLDVHHIVPIPFGDDDPDNLAVVCRECHRKISVALCGYQSKLFEEYGNVYVDQTTRNKIDLIRRTHVYGYDQSAVNV
jgi:HNH endonuclease